MTDEQRDEEASEEIIEDLEAPAAAQAGVGGGGAVCGKPSVICLNPTCEDSDGECSQESHLIVIWER
jgi:hypothetical protein